MKTFLITLVLAVFVSAIIGAIFFGVINSVIKMPYVINHYGNMLLMLYIIVKHYYSFRSFVVRNF